MSINNISFERKGRDIFAKIQQDDKAVQQIAINGKYNLTITERVQNINLSPYLREEKKYEPFFYGNASEKGVTAYGDIEDYASGEIFINWEVFNDGALDEYKVLSDLPYRLIAPEQSDVISSFLCHGGFMDIERGGKYTNQKDQNDICAMALMPKFERHRVDVFEDTDGTWQYTQDVRYVFRPMGLNGVRLAWVNKYGVLDFWNFDKLREQNFVTSAETIYTYNGYTKLNHQAEKHYTIETRELTREALDALSFIVASPAVWFVEDTGDGLDEHCFTPIDIITDSCKVYSDNELLALQISYRPKMREL